jgi:hypothetical protein
MDTVAAYFFGGPFHGQMRTVIAHTITSRQGPIQIPPILYECDWITDADPDDPERSEQARRHVRYLRTENQRVPGSSRWVYQYDERNGPRVDYAVPDDAASLADR